MRIMQTVDKNGDQNMEKRVSCMWADIPDMDVIRDKEAYYMVSTSMHSMPGCPIMKSYDLVRWEIVSYVFDTFEDNEHHRLLDGRGIYGKGSWAASLRKVGGYYYCMFNCNNMGQSYIFRTKDIESDNWEKHVIPKSMHDPALLIDGDKYYVLFGCGDIHIVQLTDDLLAVREDVPERILFSTPTENIGLRCEGGHAYRIGDKYYFLYIEWPRDGHGRRREICYRAESLDGPFERRVMLDDDFGYHNLGLAQGALIDRPDGSYAVTLFQDHGAVGRIPYFLPVEWHDGWPEITAHKGDILSDLSGILDCDDFDHQENRLARCWQWNHNPDNSLWSFTENPGYLRLHNGYLSSKGLLTAVNTLTQRTAGPECVSSTHLILSGMKPGDSAGLAAVQGLFGMIGIRAYADGRRNVVMCVNDGNGCEKVVSSVAYTQDDIFLKIEYDFKDNTDKATFLFSTDGNVWSQLGDTLQLRYTLEHFMGVRSGLYSYATMETGGYVDFEYYDIKIG